jgi:hypothetical protein
MIDPLLLVVYFVGSLNNYYGLGELKRSIYIMERSYCFNLYILTLYAVKGHLVTLILLIFEINSSAAYKERSILS